MSTTETGQRAEMAVAEQLGRDGHTIIKRNWRTRWCEIDIVTTKADIVYFVEVKYRQRSDWGDGLDHISGNKLRHMQRAATIWQNQYAEADICLIAVAVSGDDFMVGPLVELL